MIDGTPSLKQLNRTLIGSVLFVDIAGFSERPQPDQLEMKEWFNNMLAEAVHDVPPGERFMMDTEAGAAIAFLGDPEDAMFTALSLRGAIEAAGISVGEPGFVRMGIHLGPMKVVRDLNGNITLVGDGVDDAQFAMRFAGPGQMMVSNAYFDIISRISRDYVPLFAREGNCPDDKEQRHDVYRFAPQGTREEVASMLRERARARLMLADNEISPSVETPAPSLAPRPDLQPGGPERQSHVRLVARVMAAATVALTIAIFWPWTGKTAQAPIVAGASSYSQAAEISIPYRPRLEPGKAADIRADVKLAAASPHAAKTVPHTAASERESDTAGKLSPAALPSVPGVVRLAIQPWGEIYVDGTKRGVSPPMKSISLAPGTHHIEIRNGGFAPYKETVEVKSGGEVTVQYVF